MYMHRNILTDSLNKGWFTCKIHKIKKPIEQGCIFIVSFTDSPLFTMDWLL